MAGLLGCYTTRRGNTLPIPIFAKAFDRIANPACGLSKQKARVTAAHGCNGQASCGTGGAPPRTRRLAPAHALSAFLQSGHHGEATKAAAIGFPDTLAFGRKRSLCQSGVWKAPPSAPYLFGGSYITQNGSCVIANPFLGLCGCPSGYGGSIVANMGWVSAQQIWSVICHKAG